MNEVKIFESSKFGSVRTVNENGDILFCAKDVALSLEYASTNMTQIFSAVPDEWKGSKPIATLGGSQEMLCLSEQGLYFFLGRSDKPKALPYQKWLAGEVIPSIRKHGGYLTAEKIEEVLLNPDTIIQLAQALKSERQQKQALEAQIEADRPKVLFADSVSASETSILIRELAKLLSQNNIEIGEKRLFEWLRENGYLIRQLGSDYNSPTQRAMDLSLFEVKETSITHSDGHITISRTPKVTGKGQRYFMNKFLNPARLAA